MSHSHVAQVCKALLDPPAFQPQKLEVSYLNGAKNLALKQALSRRYTLTHNDFTGNLTLSIGSDYNYPQISSAYSQVLRDEILAEWKFHERQPSLHIYCHVSGKERWVAPPQLRNYIFRREMRLVRKLFQFTASPPPPAINYF